MVIAVERPADVAGGVALEQSNVQLSSEQVAFFNRQLASMAKLNMPLASGLRVMAREVTDPSFKKVLDGIQRDLEEGRQLHDAVARYPRTFSPTYVEILRAGVTAGNLAIVLDELTRFTETVEKVKTQLRSTMLYPIVVGFLVTAFVVAFFWFIVPSFAGLYASGGLVRIENGYIVDFHESIEGAPPVLFHLSNFLRNPIVVVLGLILAIAIVVGAASALRRGWERNSEYMFRLPLLGGLQRKATLMRVTRTLRDLLMNGVPMVTSLRLVSRITGENSVRDRLDEVRATVEEGGSFSRALPPEVFSETVVWKLQIAEEKGIIETALGEVARDYERDIETRTAYIAGVAAPALLIFFSLIVAVLLILLYPQLIKMATTSLPS